VIDSIRRHVDSAGHDEVHLICRVTNGMFANTYQELCITFSAWKARTKNKSDMIYQSLSEC
jgi:hypothetical protein